MFIAHKLDLYHLLYFYFNHNSNNQNKSLKINYIKILKKFVNFKLFV